MNERVFKGMTGNLVITDAGVSISRGKKGFAATRMLRGEKLIPWDSIVAVQFKKASVISGSGYLQLSLRGGSEAKGGLGQAVKDENTIMWANLRSAQKNEEFGEARDLIQARIAPEAEATKVCPECAEQVKSGAKVCRFCGHRFDS
ncbi:MAG TPA: zinc ribbon domain-containing protein [Gaiellaceae bacterium]|nr:zinc ribbon domain-containing protein [Gaiellaceae bacterium]